MLETLQEEQAANQERLFDLEKRYVNANVYVYGSHTHTHTHTYARAHTHTHVYSFTCTSAIVWCHMFATCWLAYHFKTRRQPRTRQN